MGFLVKLQEKWQLKGITQVVIVLIVFACTGTTVVFIKQPLFALLGIQLKGWIGFVLYLILILPLYQVLLLGYGFIFGQFKFFWEFEKRTWQRLFRKKQNSTKV
ncbi:MAG: hypothetical protein EAZ44_02980 [Cytophagia bacterium]|nr:MAG: hypothetical protein EAZ44_02980 [Cytophagia bacterium]TAG43640.1 MAG: hypothetical protein EAZ31_03815 [Cytophagia bacterium]